MNYPYCQSCPRFEDPIQGCSAPGACPWEAWADGILYHPAKKTAGGTGVGFPALVQIGDSWQRGWLKAQEEGKTGGYDWAH